MVVLADSFVWIYKVNTEFNIPESIAIKKKVLLVRKVFQYFSEIIGKKRKYQQQQKYYV